MMTFSINLRCDGCRKSLDTTFETGYLIHLSQEGRVDMEQSALRKGWVIDRGSYFCPECQIQQQPVGRSA